MHVEHQLSFARYRLDLASEQLWCGSQEIPLPAKAFALLRYLVEHAGQLVSKAELFTALWPGTVVTDGALTYCVGEVRRALGDDPKAPQFIETVHRRGYRFLPTVTTAPPVASSQYPVASRKAETRSSQLTTDRWQRTILLVGREPELAQLHQLLDRARDGERQIVFVTGEPGIGKTTLVGAFRLSLAGQSLWVGHGQCIEQHGAGEAFLPVLDALGRLARETEGARLIEILRTYAPMWLVQLPAFIDGEELETVQRKVQGASHERMLRELAEALERLAAEQPVIIVLEDLHWSDVSTLDLLAFLARRKDPARLLVIGTYRPVEMLNDGHPLQGVTQELYAHQLATELALRVLSEAETATYLAARFQVPSPLTREGQGEGERARVLQNLAPLLHHRTGGNPLFLVSTVDELETQGVLTRGDNFEALPEEVANIGIAESIRHLVARQSGRLSAEERQMLEAASVAGMEFSAAAVAAALKTDTMAIERYCEQLAERQHFLRRVGIEEWPDGTLAARYSFLHALYQQLWHERVTPTQLQQQHLRIGERKEQAYGVRTREIATELAVHFEQGRDYRKMVQYLEHAGKNALRRAAQHEALSHFSKGLEVLKLLPETLELTRSELILNLALSASMINIHGPGAAAVESAFVRAWELGQLQEQPPLILSAFIGLLSFRLVRAEYQAAQALAEQGLWLAQNKSNLPLLMAAYSALGIIAFYQGEFVSAREYWEQGSTFSDPQAYSSTRLLIHPGQYALPHIALTLWNLGHPEQAAHESQLALQQAEEQEQYFRLAYMLMYDTLLNSLCGESQNAQEKAEAFIQVVTDYGLLFMQPMARFLHEAQRWGPLTHEPGERSIEQLRSHLGTFRETGARLWIPYLLTLLAQAYAKQGQVEQGLATLNEALTIVDKTGECFHAAELYRVKGMLTLQSKVLDPKSKVQEAEECFHKAIEIARKQQAKSLELRATMSLARLWQRQGKRHEAHKMLSEIYHWFTEGFDTADLKEAKALLEELSH
jgi:DNA-binding winged helix-turn-helix (wHTH) protein/tetratricopeptide (TPR) repeat protein